MTAVLFILFYLWCCYMAFGYAYADFRTDCREDEWREAAGFAAASAFAGPLSLLVAFLLTGFGRHGRRYPFLKGGQR